MIPATISIDPARIIAAVDDRIYSGFIEHLGRCIYGGIVPTPDTASELVTPGTVAFRDDVLKLIRDELRVPVMRWPGGNFVSSYRWKDGIGPMHLRPSRPELAWGGVETNAFGTDEFMYWCREAKTEPFICLNMGTGSLEDALDWLEYCNGSSNTYWANLRRANNPDHPEPYSVKYWALGNEMYGDWQVGQLTAAEYTQKAKRWVHALKLMDPSITLIGCGQNGMTSWDATTLQGLINHTDLHSLHYYSSLGKRDRTDGLEYERVVFGPEAAERGIEITKSLIDLARLEHATDVSRPVKIVYDEWGPWDDAKGTSENGLEQAFTLTDALAVASWLNVFIRKADVVVMANYAQAVNVIAPIMTSPTGLFKQTVYHPLHLFSKYMRGQASSAGDGATMKAYAIDLHVDSPSYTGVTLPTWINRLGKEEGRCKWIDASCVLVRQSGEEKGSESTLRIAVVNRHKTQAFNVSFKLAGVKVSSDVVVCQVWHQDCEAVNSFENPSNVETTTMVEAWTGERRFKSHSFSLLMMRVDLT